MPPLPPPTPVTAIGYPVQVIGRVVRFYDTRQIIVESIGKCCAMYLLRQLSVSTCLLFTNATWEWT